MIDLQGTFFPNPRWMNSTNEKGNFITSIATEILALDIPIRSNVEFQLISAPFKPLLICKGKNIKVFHGSYLIL